MLRSHPRRAFPSTLKSPKSEDNPLKSTSDAWIVSSGVGDPSAALLSSAKSLSKLCEIDLANTAARTFSRVSGGKELTTTRGGGRGRGVCRGDSLASPTDCLGDATLFCSMVVHARGGRIPGTRDGDYRGGDGRLDEPPWVSNVGDTALSSWPTCLLYTSPSPRDRQKSRMPSSA